MRAASVLFLVFLAVIFMTSSGAFAHEERGSHTAALLAVEQSADAPSHAPLLDATSSATVEYALPFPGILPTHPLYFLKSLRDKLLDILIQDPSRRIEYLTLMADKRYAMGEALTRANEMDEAVSIMEEAESYFGRVVTFMHDLKNSGRSVSAEEVNRVVLSGKKHQEVVRLLNEKGLEQYDERLDKISTQIAENIRKLEEINN